MTRADLMMRYLPEYMRSSSVLQSILTSEGEELKDLNDAIDNTLKQFFAETATDIGLELWEHELGIKTYSKTLTERRSTVISKLRGVGNVTVSLIQSVAQSFGLGAVAVAEKAYTYAFDTYRETESPDPYTINVYFVNVLGIPSNINDCKDAISAVIPAHILVNYVYNYMTWDVLEARDLTWDQLDTLGLTWTVFETGNWTT